jgi:hypothetical protein
MASEKQNSYLPWGNDRILFVARFELTATLLALCLPQAYKYHIESRHNGKAPKLWSLFPFHFRHVRQISGQESGPSRKQINCLVAEPEVSIPKPAIG